MFINFFVQYLFVFFSLHFLIWYYFLFSLLLWLLLYYRFHYHLYQLLNLFFLHFCFFFVLFSRVFVLLLIKQLIFSHETVRVCKLFCLLVYLLLFLEVKLQDKNLQHHCFSPAPKRFTILLIYCHFDVILDLILNFTIFVATHFIINLFQKIIW